ncbi:MAG: hypothetical protein KBF93_20800 [Leptospiraceae bacterium]|nr:hypothetical protein [Leptospiraceae bacterium]
MSILLIMSKNPSSHSWALAGGLTGFTEFYTFLYKTLPTQLRDVSS